MRPPSPSPAGYHPTKRPACMSASSPVHLVQTGRSVRMAVRSSMGRRAAPVPPSLPALSFDDTSSCTGRHSSLSKHSFTLVSIDHALCLFRGDSVHNLSQPHPTPSTPTPDPIPDPQHRPSQPSPHSPSRTSPERTHPSASHLPNNLTIPSCPTLATSAGKARAILSSFYNFIVVREYSRGEQM